jgi:hypothetical protein
MAKPSRPFSQRAFWPKKEAYDQLGVGNTKGDELCATGELDAFKIGKKVVVSGESMDRYANAMPKAQIQIPAAVRRRVEQTAA